MTDFDRGVLQTAMFLFSGLAFRSMADGHWSDWTKKQNNIWFKFAVVVMSWFCFIQAFITIITMGFGPIWAMVMLFTVLAAWFLWDGSI